MLLTDFRATIESCRDTAPQALLVLADFLKTELSRVNILKLESAERCELLNEMCFGLGDPKIRPVLWQHIVDITGENPDSPLDAELIIAIYEIAAEPPEVPWLLELLFSLENNLQKRWVIFEAHRSWPRLFLKHLNKYSLGTISRSEYTAWLRAQGLLMTASGLRRPRQH